MNKTTYIAAAVLCLVCACARTVTPSIHEADKRSFDAWVHVQKELHPEYLWKQTNLGSYILEEEAGTGALLAPSSDDTLYVYIDHTVSGLNGTINSTSDPRLAQQLGTYDETYYYGPSVAYFGGTYAGVEDAMTGMRVGGRRKVAMPGWLLTYKRYDQASKYLNDSTSNAALIYDIKLAGFFPDPYEWELDSVSRYITRHFPQRFGTSAPLAKADSAGAHGFYYVQEKAPTGTFAEGDTTIYINYTGRLLNGRVFDTTIRDTAMFYGLYSSSTKYQPATATYSSDYSKVKLGGNTVIEGFARTIARMQKGETACGIFYSPLGYSTSGSGSRIPAYSPLCFEVSIVDK